MPPFISTRPLKFVLQIVVLASIQFNGFSQNTGIFDAHGDVGAVLHKGEVIYNAASEQYQLSGAGANIWFAHDEMHFLWKKLKGDFILQARGAFIGKGTDPHRKFGWMIRKNLDSSSAMVCATVHGDGLTSIQYRKSHAANVEETRSSVEGPDFIQLEKKGNRYVMSVARYGEPLASEQINNIDLGDDIYAGLFICSHNKDVVEKVMMDNVRIIIPAKDDFVPYRQYIGSKVEILDVANGKRLVVYSSPASLQAPNWTKDGKTLVYNSNGLIYLLDLKTGKARELNTGIVKKNNNDHVLSFDGKFLGLSSSSADPKYGSIVYTIPLKGGKPKQITPTGPSYLHGWSPDGKYLLFTAQRNNEFDIYKIPSGGGEEIRLTTSPGLDDGAEYSPDGNFIYFNSVRSGKMQLWRMKADGSSQEQITSDEYNNWFPHVSPDGKCIVFLSFMKDIEASDHPFYKHVYLRMMLVNGGQPKIIAYVYGGQGSINTPSWSPDSKRIAFVSNSDQVSK